MFCPQCDSEYKPGFTRCSDCDIPLVDRLPRQRDNSAPLVRLRSYPNDGELFLAKSVLESAGIDAMTSPSEQYPPLTRSFGVGLPATDLYVRAEDAVLANEILARVSQGVSEE
jgi:hypothetical protein